MPIFIIISFWVLLTAQVWNYFPIPSSVFCHHRHKPFPIIVLSLCSPWPYVTPASLNFLCTIIYQLWSSSSFLLYLLFTARSDPLYLSHSSSTLLLYFYLLYWNLSSCSTPLQSYILASLWLIMFLSTCLHSAPLQSYLIVPLRSVLSNMIDPFILLYTCSSMYCTAH